MHKTISILIPCFNSAQYIAETLNSVINQTCPDWECIIVDDHSSDNSVEIIEEYCQQHPNLIKLFTNPRKGACAARNYAFEKSIGEFIQYLDSDDILASNKIQKQIQSFQKKIDANLIVSGIWGKFENSKEKVEWQNHQINKDYSSPINWLVDSWNGGGMAQTAAWLTPRPLIEKAGPWNESLKINQDGEFFSRVLMKANGIKYCKDAKVYYRTGNINSISQNNKSKVKAVSLLKSYQLYKKNVNAYLEDVKVRKALANNFLNFIYLYYRSFPTLASEAEKEFYDLNVGKMWSVGGRKFRLLSKTIGFKSAIQLLRTL